MTLRVQNSRSVCFSVNIWNISFHSRLACMVSQKKVILILCSFIGNVYFFLWLLSGFLKFIFDFEHDKEGFLWTHLYPSSLSTEERGLRRQATAPRTLPLCPLVKVRVERTFQSSAAPLSILWQILNLFQITSACVATCSRQFLWGDSRALNCGFSNTASCAHGVHRCLVLLPGCSISVSRVQPKCGDLQSSPGD